MLQAQAWEAQAALECSGGTSGGTFATSGGATGTSGAGGTSAGGKVVLVVMWHGPNMTLS